MEELSYDEIILQIRKNNKEAFGLLFSLVEIYMRYQANKMIFSEKVFSHTIEDFSLIARSITIESINYYEMDKALFFSYWKIILMRRFFDEKEKFKKENFYEMNKISLDENLLNYKYFEKGQVLLDSQYDLKEQYRLNIEKIDINFGKKTSKILKLWCEGYSYQEIAKKANVTLSKVNYEVSKAINYLKKVTKKDKLD